MKCREARTSPNKTIAGKIDAMINASRLNMGGLMSLGVFRWSE
ncbi:MAG TPA: hypothetical protein VEM34_07050 [Burkholderiales bacterium]|nr:hypothetical protein [Burkholderiales bacterium]